MKTENIDKGIELLQRYKRASEVFDLIDNEEFTTITITCSYFGTTKSFKTQNIEDEEFFSEMLLNLKERMLSEIKEL